MSLINDALRRALQTRRTPPKPADGPTLTPADTPPAPRWPVAAVPLLLMGVVLVAAWFLQQGLQPTRQAAALAPDTPVAAREASIAAPQQPDASIDLGGPAPSQLPLLSTSLPAPAQSDAGVEPVKPVAGVVPDEISANVTSNPTGPAAAAPASATATTAAPAPPTNPPPPKLKAIFYRPSDPWAMINTKTVRVGDRVGQARVIAITPDSVSLLLPDGQTNVLTLGD
jgi:hypothetical protein